MVPHDSKSDLPLDVLVTDTIGSEKNEMFVRLENDILLIFEAYKDGRE